MFLLANIREYRCLMHLASLDFLLPPPPLPPPTLPLPPPPSPYLESVDMDKLFSEYMDYSPAPFDSPPPRPPLPFLHPHTLFLPSYSFSPSYSSFSFITDGGHEQNVLGILYMNYIWHSQTIKEIHFFTVTENNLCPTYKGFKNKQTKANVIPGATRGSK